MTTSIRHYENFDLDLSKTEAGYCARVLASPAGEGDEHFTLPFSDAELSQGLDLPSGSVRTQARAGAGATAGSPLHDPRALGKLLFERVFVGQINNLFVESLAEAKRRKSGLRIRLRLTLAPQLAVLPWEYLYDTRHRRYFCRSIQMPIVRYLELPQKVEPLQVALPLRILVVISDPSDVGPKLNVENEWQKLVSALDDLQTRKVVVLERFDKPTVARLQERFRQDQAIHILHFIGHGGYDPTAGTGGLLLEESDGTGCFVSAATLCDILADYEPRLIFLNSCEGATISATNPLSGTAQQLVQQGVPAVIAMQFVIIDSTATTLAQEFYRALAEGNPVDAALAVARKAVAASGSEMEWGTPVLFMRAADGYLFDVAAWLPTPPCPYPGMLPYTTADQQKFYGRTAEIEDAILALREHPLLTVIGASGVGKSSLVFAGIVPQLCQTSFFGKTQWQVKTLRPGPTPLTTLATTLGLAPQTLKGEPKPTEEQQTEQPPPLALPGVAPDGTMLLLVIDQFEELFTQSDPAEVVDFQIALCYLIRTRQCHIILTVRADFYEDLLASPLWDDVKDHRLELKPLDTQGLREAILQPAADVDVQIDPALVERLLADAANEPGMMPLIQETLVLLWDRVKQRFLSVKAYTDLTRRGPNRTGLQVAIARRADHTLQTLTETAHPLAQRVFLRLVQFGEGRNDTRRQQPLSALQAVGDEATLFANTLNHFVSARLLTINGAEQEEEDRVDIAHEALITGWPTFQAWLTKSRTAEQTRRELEAKALEWETRQRQGALLDQLEWQEAQAWLASDSAQELGCSQSLSELVQASHLALHRQKLMHRLTQAAGIVILLLLGLAGFLGIRAVAVAEEGERGESQRIANLAFQQLLVDPAQSLRVVAARLPDATPKPYAPEIEAVAYQALQVNLQHTVLDLSALPAVGQVLTTDQIQPGRTWLAAGGTQLWLVDLAAGQVITQAGHTEPVVAVQWDQTGELLLSRAPHHLRLWQGGQAQGELSLTHAEIGCAEWRPNHAQIAVCHGNAVLLWTPADQTVTKIGSFSNTVSSALWSPEGRWLALWEVKSSAAATQTLLVWDAVQGAPHFTQQFASSNAMRSGAWSPDEQAFVTLHTKEIGLWTLNDPAAGRSLAVRVTGVAFVDNTTFLTWSPKAVTRRWSVADGSEIQAYGSDQDNVQGIQLSSEHNQLLTFADKGADLWDLATGERLAALCCHALPIRLASWRDERYLATAGKDGTVRLWDLTESREVLTLRGHKGRNASGRADVFNALWLDGQTLLTYGADGTIRRWQLFDKAGQPLCNGVDERGIPLCQQFSHTFPTLPGEVRGLHWANGAFVALSINVDNTVQQTHFSQTAVLTRTVAISLASSSMILTPDGKYLIQPVNGEMVLVGLDADTHSKVTLRGASATLSAAALAPDGQLATADQQGLIQLWSLPEGRELAQFGADLPPAEQLPIRELRWSADSQALLTAGRQVARWAVASGERRWVSAETGLAAHIALSQDDKLVGVALDRRLLVFDAQSGALLWQNAAYDQPMGGVQWVETTPWPNQNRHWAWIDGLARRLVGRPPAVDTPRQLLFVWSGDGTVRLWDWQARTEVLRLSEAGPIYAAASSPDGAQILSVALQPNGDPGPTRLWQNWLPDPAALTEMVNTLTNRSNP